MTCDLIRQKDESIHVTYSNNGEASFSRWYIIASINRYMNEFDIRSTNIRNVIYILVVTYVFLFDHSGEEWYDIQQLLLYNNLGDLLE